MFSRCVLCCPSSRRPKSGAYVLKPISLDGLVSKLFEILSDYPINKTSIDKCSVRIVNELYAPYDKAAYLAHDLDVKCREPILLFGSVVSKSMLLNRCKRIYFSKNAPYILGALLMLMIIAPNTGFRTVACAKNWYRMYYRTIPHFGENYTFEYAEYDINVLKSEGIWKTYKMAILDDHGFIWRQTTKFDYKVHACKLVNERIARNAYKSIPVDLLEDLLKNYGNITILKMDFTDTFNTLKIGDVVDHKGVCKNVLKRPLFINSNFHAKVSELIADELFDAGFRNFVVFVDDIFITEPVDEKNINGKVDRFLNTMRTKYRLELNHSKTIRTTKITEPFKFVGFTIDDVDGKAIVSPRQSIEKNTDYKIDDIDNDDTKLDNNSN